MTGFTKESLAKAMQALAENDAAMPDWDGRLYCYEWEASALLASGIKPERLVIIPSKIPTR